MEREKDDEKRWTEENEIIFLNLLHTRVKNDPNGAPSFKKSDWIEMDRDMVTRTNEITSVTYDHSTFMVNAPQEVWDQLLKLNKRNWQPIKTHGCKNFDLMREVFGKSTATGDLHHASTAIPLDSDEEREIEEDYLFQGNSQKRGSTYRFDEEPSKRRSGRSYRSKTTAVDKVLEDISQSIRARNESKNTKASTRTSVKEEISQCVQILDSMENVSTTAYSRAVDEIITYETRRFVFLSQCPRRQLEWILSFENKSTTS